MGTWGAGPFENDQAADFGGDLDDLAERDRPAAIRAALNAVAMEVEYLDADDGTDAVAAAAIVAAQCAGGATVGLEHYGPKGTIPPLPAELRPLAVQALDRVAGENSELADLWADADDQEWLEHVRRLKEILSAAYL
ncbi:DUF4259 domain-containing protein [Spirillospora sp. NPDC052269]